MGRNIHDALERTVLQQAMRVPGLTSGKGRDIVESGGAYIMVGRHT